ncbi:MAG: DUF6452 family protein [Bacteroidota bacterium]
MIGFTSYNNLENEEIVSPPSGLLIYGYKDGKDMLGNPESEEYPEYIYPDMRQANENKLIPLIFDVNKDNLTYIFEFVTDEETKIHDTISLSYKRKQIFINQNCGYKSTFYEVKIESFTKNAIEEATLLTQTIEYDTEKHINILLK